MKKLLLILIALPMIGFGQLTYVPDDAFENYLEVHGMGDGIASNDNVLTANINTVTSLNIAWAAGISDLTGIGDFIALNTLDCSSNQLTSLDVSQNTALTYLSCGGNQLTTIDVSGATALTELYCINNQLTSLDVSQNTSLTQLWGSNNQLTSLDVSNNTALTELNCINNQLTSIDLSNNTSLVYLNCDENQLTSLDVSNNTALTNLGCTINNIECLDISNNTNLNFLSCTDNLLEQLNTKNGNWVNMTVNALNNNLMCVEVDNIGAATNDWDFDSFTTISTNCNYTNPCSNNSTFLQEHTTNKELLKITDILGRETKQTNQPLFYIYDDGTVEKRIVIE